MSGQCGGTAPVASELCCISAGRAWGATCACPLHVAVAEPGLTGNVHGLKVCYVTFQFGKWCWRAQKCDFFSIPVRMVLDILLIWKLVTSLKQLVRICALFDYLIRQMLLFLCEPLLILGEGCHVICNDCSCFFGTYCFVKVRSLCCCG